MVIPVEWYISNYMIVAIVMALFGLNIYFQHVRDIGSVPSHQFVGIAFIIIFWPLALLLITFANLWYFVTGKKGKS